MENTSKTTERTILNIHTCTDIAIVNIAKDGKVICEDRNATAKLHGEFLHAAIGKLCKSSGVRIADLDAIAVTTGPGSYTGIRVGFAAAKGLCYAMTTPLITVNTLELLAACAIEKTRQNAVYIPMLDARRMEVYAAAYNKRLNLLLAPQALVLEADSFTNVAGDRTYFFGDGSQKFEQLLDQQKPGYSFLDVDFESEAFAALTFEKYNHLNFANVAYSEPQYLKEFFTGSRP